MAALGAIGEVRENEFASLNSTSVFGVSGATASGLVTENDIACTLNSAFALNITLNPITGICNLPGGLPVPEAWKYINGFAKNSSGVGIQRRVLIIDQVSQTVVYATDSSAVDGSFVGRAPFAQKVTAYVVPQTGDNRNGVVLSDLIPI